jgi:hypothetical protein
MGMEGVLAASRSMPMVVAAAKALVALMKVLREEIADEMLMDVLSLLP